MAMDKTDPLKHLGSLDFQLKENILLPNVMSSLNKKYD